MSLAIPQQPGSYALEYLLEQAVDLQIGKLGKIRFQPGVYLYLGSAHGPGGLRARLSRHLCQPRNALHWHIDYFAAAAQVLACCYLLQPQVPRAAPLAIECLWSQSALAIAAAYIPAAGFGSSDCRSNCPAHLVAFPLLQKPLLLGMQQTREKLAQAVGVAAAEICLLHSNSTW